MDADCRACLICSTCESVMLSDCAKSFGHDGMLANDDGDDDDVLSIVRLTLMFISSAECVDANLLLTPIIGNVRTLFNEE